MGINSQGRLLLSLIVLSVIFVVEVIGGIISRSLALLSDAGHVFTDAFALLLSLIAATIMKKMPDYRATYGYQRIGILAAFINGMSLVGIAVFIFVEGYKRFNSPPQIDSELMLGIATAGLIGNLIMAWILGHKHEDLNIKSAWFHVIGDTISSAGVIAAGLIIKFTGWLIVDPIASGLVGIIIITGGIRVIKEALWIFLELSPAGLRVDEITESLSRIPGVLNIHDVHIWSIGHGIPAFSAHVQIHDQKISEADNIRKRIEHELEHFGIRHSVIQMECAECVEKGLYCNINSGGTTGHKH